MVPGMMNFFFFSIQPQLLFIGCYHLAFLSSPRFATGFGTFQAGSVPEVAELPNDLPLRCFVEQGQHNQPSWTPCKWKRTPRSPFVSLTGLAKSLQQNPRSLSQRRQGGPRWLREEQGPNLIGLELCPSHQGLV